MILQLTLAIGQPLLNVASPHAPLDVDLLDLKKIFQTWIFVYRLRTFRKIEECSKNSVPFVRDILKLFTKNQTAAIVIQTWARGILAVEKCRLQRQAMHVLWERSNALRQICRHRCRQRTFKEMEFMVFHAKQARLTLQCWFRQCISRVKCKNRKVELGILQQREFTVFRLHRRHALSKIMRLMEFGCALRCCAIQLSSPRERNLQKGGTKRPLQSLESKQMRTRLAKKKTLSMIDFTSDVYHNHMYRLKQTGILVLDSSNTSTLKPNELAHLIQSATTLFSQSSGEHVTVKDIANNFKGSKIIFCGGMISEINAYDLYYLLTSREEKIVINFTEVAVCFRAVSKIARSLEHSFAKIRELSIDSDSIGSLGIAALLVSLKVTCGCCHMYSLIQYLINDYYRAI